MRAGKLRHTITIEQNTPTQNSYGEPVDAWSTFATVRAQVEPISGREYFDAQKVDADVDYRVRIRYLSGVTNEMRIVYGSKQLDIESVLNIGERDREIHIMCKERL